MHTDQRQKELQDLSLRIRQGILEKGICELNTSEMEFIWQEDLQELALSDKRLCVKRFAKQYGFAAMVEFDLSRAVFINAN